MPANSNPEKTREHLKTILGGVAGLSPSRVSLGFDDLSATDEFYQTIASSGPRLLIRPPTFDDVGMHSRLTEFQLEVRLYYGFAADQDADMVPLGDLNAAVIAAISDAGNYAGAIGVSRPDLGISSSFEEDLSLKPRIVMYRYSLKFRGTA